MTTQYTKDDTAYETCGNPAGLPLVLIHGLGLSRSTWDGLMPALTESHRVIRYDLFGHGMSGLPPRTPDLKLFAEQIVNLMNHLSIPKAVMIGFSLGGMINRRLALDCEERVAGLVVLNSPHERNPEEQAKVETRACMTAEDGIEATLEETLKRWFTPDFIRNNSEAVDAVRQGVLANPLEAYAACRYVLAAGVVELIRPARPPELPTLVMTTSDDSGSTPAMSKAIAGEIPNAICTIIPNLQHMGLVERPDLFIKEIRPFLDTISLQGEA